MGKLQNRIKKFWSLFDDTFEFLFCLEYFKRKASANLVSCQQHGVGEILLRQNPKFCGALISKRVRRSGCTGGHDK
jgi:hypothetical protein